MTILLHKILEEIPSNSELFVLIDKLHKWEINSPNLSEISEINWQKISRDYQNLLSLTQIQKKIGAFYTPRKTVEYMIKALAPKENDIVLDPACGSGHFLESLMNVLKQKKSAQEKSKKSGERLWNDIFSQVWGCDIDPFAIMLAKTRLQTVPERIKEGLQPKVLLYDPLLQQSASSEPKYTDRITLFNQTGFDCIIGNPPYGKDQNAGLKKQYKQIFRKDALIYNYRLQSNDIFGYFIAYVIKRVKDGGKICLLVSDTFLSLKSHSELRRLILDTCAIKEILLPPIDLFRPIAIPRTCIITLTKKLCQNGYKIPRNDPLWQDKSDCSCKKCQARKMNTIRLIDRLENEDEYETIVPHKIMEIPQEIYEKISLTPFWINIPQKIIDIMMDMTQKTGDSIIKGIKFHPLGEYIEGGAGIQTGKNTHHVKIIKGTDLWKDLKQKGSKQLSKYGVELPSKIAILPDIDTLDEEKLVDLQNNGIAENKCLVPFKRNNLRDTYCNNEEWYIDWSQESVQEIKDLAKKSKGRSAVFRNPHLYFREGIITDAHHGILSCCLVDKSIHAVNTNLFYGKKISNLFLLGYLNSNFISYILGNIINTTFGGMSGHATPSDIKRLPLPIPINATDPSFFNFKQVLISSVEAILTKLQRDKYADISAEEAEINRQIYHILRLNKEEQQIIEQYIQRMNEERKKY